MALMAHLPAFGCEHLNRENLDKIAEARTVSKASVDPDFVQYTCLFCPTRGSFPSLNRHFTKTKHDFAISSNTIYCGQCNDLVYDPSLLKVNVRKRKIVLLSEEDESYMSANTSQRPCGREGVRGLFNLGETCYMNAVLQMMVHNPLLSSYFLGMGHPLHTCPISKEPEKKNESDDSDDENSEDKEQKACVACAMTELFSDSSMVDQSLPAHAVNLLFASWKNIPDMSGKGQQDAQEWFTFIVDKLHEAVTNPTQSSSKPPTHQCKCFFHRVFYGRFYSDVTCDTCHNTTTNEEEYSSIGLDFKKQVKRKKKELNNSTEKDSKSSDSKNKSSSNAAAVAPALPTPNIHDCLKTYTAPEPLPSESYTCKSCSAPRSATKRLRIRKLPAILCVHVKRFGMKKVNGIHMPEKYEGKIQFPLTLDMGTYTSAPTTSNGLDKPSTTSTKKAAAESKAVHVRDTNQPEFLYDLDCVVVHQGDHAHTGHYFAFCRQGGKWFRFDDEIVSATTTEDVLRQEAYLLFYGLRTIGRSAT